uniref:Uncharacterized protein n=1 Tax=Bicosoecida sp. CB-2014 TaxID=1486930 RepID=A0A7S1GBD9_9STRA|mmetsp:Transcript_25258/g.88111  ORF Transcript_25258/g.88111 Transcript_25258/m.88111 type:complete len:380 (+) Transcript_25258:184-1323(+)
MADDEEAPQASDLSQKALRDELEKRGIKPTGFPADDIRLLQARFDQEWAAEKQERDAKRFAAQQRKQAEEAELRKRRLLERQRAEEEDAVNSDARVRFWIDLVKDNATPADTVLRVSPVATRAFAKALRDNTSLVTLDLCRCELKDDVGIELAKVLMTNASLRKVELGDNLLGPPTAAAMGEALSGNHSLTSLSLAHNALTANESDFKGVEALAQMLQRNTALTHLSLWHTGVGRDGGVALARAMGSNLTVLMLEVAPADNMALTETSALCAHLSRNRGRAESARLRAREELARKLVADKEAAERAAAESKRREEEEWIREQARLRTEARAAAAAQALIDEEAARVAREEEEIRKREEAKRKAEEGKKKGKKGKKGKKK